MRGLIGVDIGGSGIKGAVVDPRRGELKGERIRVETASLIAELGPDGGPVGIGLPSPIVDGTAMMAANIDKSWIGVNAAEAFSEAVGRECIVINDADAAAWRRSDSGPAGGCPASCCS
jgi:polyphosphate glucokinase